MIPDPLKDWFADPSKQAKLIEILNEPVLKEAMALLQRISLPRSNFTDRTSAEAIAHAAMEQNRTVGFFNYPDELWNLTELPAQPPKMPAGYSDSHVMAWAIRNGRFAEIEPVEQP